MVMYGNIWSHLHYFYFIQILYDNFRVLAKYKTRFFFFKSQLYSGDLSLDRDLNFDLGKHDCCTVTN